MNIAVVGAGSWGTALAQTLATAGRNVTLWAHDPTVAQTLQQTRRNPRYVTDIQLLPTITVTNQLGEAIGSVQLVIVAVPTHVFRETLSHAQSYLQPDAVVVSAAKGFEVNTGFTMTQVATDVLGESWRSRIVAMSGPNIAAEIVAGLPAATVVAASDIATATAVQTACTGPQLRFYSNTDVIGVEYGGALKNVIAIAAGICDGIGAGDNGKAAIITRGMAEMARLGVAAGADVLTFAGLTGIGDCIATCWSSFSRNRTLGEGIGKGEALATLLAQSSMVAEGVNATVAAVQLSQRYQVEMPIAHEVYAVLFDGKSVKEALGDLMNRDAGHELRGLGRDPVDSQSQGDGE